MDQRTLSPNLFWSALIPSATHLSKYAAAACLFFGAAANILLVLFLRRYNRLHERALYYQRK